MLRTSFDRVRIRRLSSDVFALTTRRMSATGSCPLFEKSTRLPDPTIQGIARDRIHAMVSSAPCSCIHMRTCITSPHTHFMIAGGSTASDVLLRPRTRRRWMSSGKQEAQAAPKEEPAKAKDEMKVEEPGRLSSIVRSVGPTLRKVTEWNLGDLVSVYAILFLITLIIVSPYAIEQMKKAARNEYGDIDEYDPVAHAEKIVRYELFGTKTEQEEKEAHGEEQKNGEGRKSVDNTVDMAADVLKSKALQEAIASLITRVLESVQFQNACQTLLKNLWNDLVNDPETTAQVVQLLNNAIQNKEIQRSVRRLVLQLIEDKEVYDELTRLLVRLGQEEKVLDATRSLLTESAHNALNDPEILDHSMEFATDVVGDDIVQRTSGEALRNTVTYAVGPGVSALLVVLGAGLVVFSISAFGRSRSTEQEAAMVDKAFSSMSRSMLSSAHGVVTYVATLPGRMLSFLLRVVTFPYRMAANAVSRIEGAGNSVISTLSGAIIYIQALPSSIVHSAMSLLKCCGRFLSEGASTSASRFGSAISGSFVGSVARSVSKASNAIFSTLSRSIKSLNHFAFVGVVAVGRSLSKTAVAMTGALSASRIFIVGFVASGRQIVGNLATDSAVLVKASLSVLAAMGASARTAASETVKGVSAHLASAGAHVSWSVAAASDRLGLAVTNAGARVSSSIAAVASWCLRWFRRDGKSDSTASTAMS